MEVKLNVLDDQIELLRRFQSLARVIKNHLGNLPDSLNGVNGHVAIIDTAIANLEFICKKWIIESSVLHSQLNEFFEGVNLKPTDPKLDDDY